MKKRKRIEGVVSKGGGVEDSGESSKETFKEGRRYEAGCDES